jgi:hypothetical protein
MLATVLARITRNSGMSTLFGILNLENAISSSKKLLLMAVHILRFVFILWCSWIKELGDIYIKLELVIM